MGLLIELRDTEGDQTAPEPAAKHKAYEREDPGQDANARLDLGYLVSAAVVALAFDRDAWPAARTVGRLIRLWRRRPRVKDDSL